MAWRVGVNDTQQLAAALDSGGAGYCALPLWTDAPSPPRHRWMRKTHRAWRNPALPPQTDLDFLRGRPRRPLQKFSDSCGYEFNQRLGNGPKIMTPVFIWILLAVILATGIGTFVSIGRAKARALRAREQVRSIHKECAAGGHTYQPHESGYRCATCGNYVSSREGQLYGRSEDGRVERRRGPR